MYFRSWAQLFRKTATAVISCSLKRYPVPSRDMTHSIPSIEGSGTLEPFISSSLASAVSSPAFLIRDSSVIGSICLTSDLPA
ncbi:hypothetical protein D3C73_1422250 [compost metagenome]